MPLTSSPLHFLLYLIHSLLSLPLLLLHLYHLTIYLPHSLVSQAVRRLPKRGRPQFDSSFCRWSFFLCNIIPVILVLQRLPCQPEVQSQFTVTGWDWTFNLQLLSQSGSTYNCLSRSVPEILACCWDIEQSTNNLFNTSTLPGSFPLLWSILLSMVSLLLLLLLRSPAISLGFTIFGWDFCVCDRFLIQPLR